MVILRDLSKDWKSLAAEADKHDIRRMQQLILDKYGFEPSERYCEDLIAFVNTFADMLEAASVSRE